MVNNPTKINKTNNHFSPQLVENKKKSITYGVGNPGLGSGGVKPLMESIEYQGKQIHHYLL